MMQQNLYKIVFFAIFPFFLLVTVSCSSKKTNFITNPLEENSVASTSYTEDIVSQSKFFHNPSSAYKIKDSFESSSLEINQEEKSFTISETYTLFNGLDLSGWVSETGKEPTGWKVESGLLRLIDPQNGSDLLSSKQFTNYILTFEWRLGFAGNSGIKYKIEQPNGKGWIGLEYQIQDDVHVKDGKIATRKTASLFDVLPASVSSKASLYPVPVTPIPSGKFRQGKIVVFGKQVEHWIDGECVLKFTIGSKEWEKAKAQSKFQKQKSFGYVVTSPILLQAHGYPIDFKSINIQTITSYD